MEEIKEKYIKHQRYWRLLFALVSTILWLWVEYLRGEFPIPNEHNLLMKIFGYFIVYPYFIVMAWFWDNKYIYNGISSSFKYQISYKTYLRIGFLFSFFFMIFFIVTTFIFPVSTEYHYGR